MWHSWAKTRCAKYDQALKYEPNWQLFSISYLDLLATEQSLVVIDAAVASSDAALVQDQIAVFKALVGGWRGTDERTSYVPGTR
jgi:hypothetical protein